MNEQKVLKRKHSYWKYYNAAWYIQPVIWI